jgi:hypothetical protein
MKTNILTVIFLFSLSMLFTGCKTMMDKEKNNFQYQMAYKLTDEWKKSDVKNYRHGFEQVILRNGKSIENKDYEASILIVHRYVPNISVRDFAMKDHELLKQNLIKSKTKLTYGPKWEPFKDKRDDLSYMSIQYSLENQGDITYEKDLYIRLENEFYIISFNAVKEEYISDEAIGFFIDSLNIVKIKSDDGTFKMDFK